jgi:hypothetical protein
MKVGITRTQLAGAVIACLQANRFLYLALFALLFVPKIWSKDALTVLPIKMAGRLVFVEANVNGTKGLFMFDTGAENLMLNSKYYETTNAISIQSEIMGFDGQAVYTSLVWTENILMGDLRLPNVRALLLDLSAMEKIKQMPIHGIIGHDLLKNTMWKLDFDRKELSLLFNTDPDPVWPFGAPPTDSIDLQFKGHLPYAYVNLGGKRLRMVLDTGSERNLLQTGAVHDQHFTQRGQIKVASLTSEASRLRAGYVPDFHIGMLQTDSLEVVLTDLRHLQQELNFRLDGILGNTFFKDSQLAIDFRRRKAYFWRRPSNGVHWNIAYENAP